MKKALVLLSALLFASSFAFGRERTQAEMDSIAKSVHTAFSLKARSLEGMAIRDQLISDAVNSYALNRQLKEAFPDIKKDFFAVYSSPNSKSGYAIISTDDRLPALIGFSDTQSFTADDMPPAMQALLVEFIWRIDDIPDHTPTMRRANSPMELAPLLGNIAFSQGSPYNVSFAEWQADSDRLSGHRHGRDYGLLQISDADAWRQDRIPDIDTPTTCQLGLRKYQIRLE